MLTDTQYYQITRGIFPAMMLKFQIHANLPIRAAAVDVSLLRDCMIDGKMCSLLGSDGGAYCHYCTVRKDETNDVLEI